MTKKRVTTTQIMPIAIIVIIGLQLLILGVSWRHSNRVEVLLDGVMNDTTHATNYINEQEFSSVLIEDPVVNPQEKRVYLPHLGLYLPMTANSANLQYMVVDLDGGGTTDVVFLSKSNPSSLGHSDPGKVQVCSRILRVEIGTTASQPRIDEATHTPFTLNDGRQVHAYTPTFPDCDGMLGVTGQDILPDIMQMQSY